MSFQSIESSVQELSPTERLRVDSVRGFLCFYVFCYHFYTTYLYREPLKLISFLVKTLLHEGYVAVQIFFALSGFLIFHSYEKTALVSSKPWSEFFLKRIFRIFPAWFICLIIYAIYAQQFQLSTFFWNFLFLFGLRPFTFNELLALHSWSLYVEEMFYICFPIFMFFYKRRMLPFVLMLYLVLYFVFRPTSPMPPGYLFYTPFNTFSYFACGMLVYLGIGHFRKARVSTVLFLTYFFVILGLSIYRVDKKELTELYILFWFTYIFCAPQKIADGFDFLFSKIGRLCYSFYLMHLVCIWVSYRIYSLLFAKLDMHFYLEITTRFMISLVLSIVSGFLLYWFIERPFIKIGQQFVFKNIRRKTI